MSVTLPVLIARMGTREYYITKMSATAISGQVSIASELADWQELTLNELYQRNLNQKRVEQDIAPYLANTKDRFFGSIIVWVLNPNVLSLEPVSDYIKVPGAYVSAAQSMGFLIIDGSKGNDSSGLVALDGQHRLAALRRVVQGNTPGPLAAEVRDDEVAVIFVRDEKVSSARDLFTVLNRSARRVSKNDVLIMGEVDGAAIIARDITANPLLAPRGLEDQPLIKWERNTIAARDTELTTLNAIYEITQLVAEHLRIDLQAGEEAGTPPIGAQLDLVRDETLHWLDALFSQSHQFAEMRHDPLKIVQMRKDGSYSLLMKPVGLQIFFGAVFTALEKDAGKVQEVEEAIRRLLSLDWQLGSAIWSGIAVNAKGNITNKKAEIQLAADLAVWMIVGENSSTTFQESLMERYRKQLGRNDAKLPDPLRL